LELGVWLAPWVDSFPKKNITFGGKGGPEIYGTTGSHTALE
jgi:hypothetical protein